MGRAAQAEAKGEQTGPVIAGPVVLVGEALTEQVLTAVFGMEVVGVAPEPRSESSVLIGPWLDADHAPVRFGLCGEQALEAGTGKLAGVPRMVGPYLRIADVSADRSNQ